MDFIFSIAILIVSVVIHEVSHGYVANLLGDPTARLEGRLTLNPLHHLDPVGSFFVPILTHITTLGKFTFGWAKPVPYNPYNLRGGKWGPAIVALAGPGANFIVALFFGALIRMADPSGAFATIAVHVVLVNLVLTVFNLIPLAPLDGSKILFALLPYQWIGVQEFLERNQMFFILILVLFLWDKIFPVVFILLRLILGA